ARQELRDHGYPEYEHALGHQLGRSVHDGGGILGPRWERYGRTPEIELETGNVFTLELEINLPGVGCVGLEEDVHVTGRGAEFLCPRQMELRIV
ncbi:MAG: M24 family metallopeptidase, partial [Candidatus Zixiibacteriota bacterium]